MRISDWSSDVCSSDLLPVEGGQSIAECGHSLFQSMMIDRALRCRNRNMSNAAPELPDAVRHRGCSRNSRQRGPVRTVNIWSAEADSRQLHRNDQRSEEHTSELQSLMRISYAVLCLKKKKTKKKTDSK